MVFNSFDDCLKSFEKIPNMEFDEFCSFFNDILREFPDKKKYLLDLFYDFDNSSVDNESNFVTVADSIVAIYKDINDLPLLLSYFDDSKEPEWAFDSLITIIEEYYLSKLPYIEMLLENITLMIPKALSWSGRLVSRILNNQEAYNIFRQNLFKADKENLLLLLTYMKNHEDDFDYVFPQIDKILKDLRE